MNIYKRTLKVIVSFLINWPKFLRMKSKGKKTIVGRGLIINGAFKEKISIGNNVTIGRFCRIGNTFGQGAGIVIGNECNIGNNFTAIDGEIIIDDNALIASGVSIFAGNHKINVNLNECNRGYSDTGMTFSPVHIGKNCWIGEKVVILPGVTIGEYSIIGAGSVVSRSIPKKSIAVGNPAKVIKKYDDSYNEWVSVQSNN